MGTFSRSRSVVTAGLILISSLLTQLPSVAQTRRRGAAQQPPRATQPRQPSSSDGAESTKGRPSTRITSLKNPAMAEAFESGRLPDPMRMPPGGVDEQASALARAVIKGDSSSTAALYAAVLAAGFGVGDRDGSVLQTVQPGQGLAFRAGEVAAIAKMYGEGRTVELVYLSGGLKSIPELKQAPLEKILLDGIRKHAQDGNSPLRFWARFIIELGRQRNEPSDILTADPKNVRLDAIQAMLILRRLAGDFYGFAQREQQASALLQAQPVQRAPARRAAAPRLNPLFIRAALHEGASPRLVRAIEAEAAHAAQRGGPCAPLGEGDAANILDAGAVIITTGWEKLLDFLRAESLLAERYSKFVKTFNILSAYAKFVITYAMLETEIAINDPPLVRTTTTVPGGERRLTARVRMNTGKLEDINCFRTALNVATGLDASLIKDGPLEGVEVNWHLVEGGDELLHSGTRGIVGFKNEGPRIQDPGAYAGIPGKGGTPVHAIPRTKTDRDGVASICLQGKPHVPYVGQPRVPVMKRAVVMTTIKIKAGDIKGDAVDVAEQALGGVAGLISLPVELLYRADWASTAWIEVYVKDWQECNRGWSGTITVIARSHEMKDNMPNGPNGWSLSHTTEVTKDIEYSFTLTGEQDTSQGFQNGYLADAQMKIDDSTVQVRKQRESMFCDTGNRDARGNKISVKVGGISTYTQSVVKTADGTTRATVYIASRGAAGYDILIEPDTSPIAGKEEWQTVTDFPECPLYEKVNSHSEEPRLRPFYLPRIKFLATLDRNNAGIISGTLIERDARSDGTVTYKWDLQRCDNYEDKPQRCN
jgi:hypothetical protein